MKTDHDIAYTPQLERILAEEAERCLCYSVLHRESEARYSHLNNFIALPCIVLSTITGATSVGSQALFGDSHYASIGIGAVSLTVGVLQTLNSYFSWARRAEGHKSSSIQYGKLHRFLMIELSLPRTSRMAAKDLLKTMRDQIDRLFEVSYPIEPIIVAGFKSRYGEYLKDIARPSVANGLDPVVVFTEEVVKEPERKPFEQVTDSKTGLVKVGFEV